jgi:glycosyltransferase involved in cell wall biosynthesis
MANSQTKLKKGKILMASTPAHKVKVLIATPLGKGGKGGIDRIMDAVRDQVSNSPPEDMDIRFGVTRGQRHIALSTYYLSRFILKLTVQRIVGGGVDVLHINLSSHGSTRRKMIIAKAARTLGVPYILHLHSSGYVSYLAEASPKLGRAISEMFHNAAKIVVLGNVWKNFVTEKFPPVKHRIVIIPNATPVPALPRISRAGDPVRILFLGRVGARKGVPQLVQALAGITDVPNWEAIIAGDGEVDQTQEAVMRLKLADKVKLTGWVGPDEVAQLLSTSDILVLPSLNENLPMSVIEGMAAGLAVVATPVGAVEDIIISEETGLLVPVGESVPLTSALKRLVEDADLRQRLGENAKSFHRRKLDMGPYIEALASLWRETARERPAKA